MILAYCRKQFCSWFGGLLIWELLFLDLVRRESCWKESHLDWWLSGFLGWLSSADGTISWVLGSWLLMKSVFLMFLSLLDLLTIGVYGFWESVLTT